MVLVKAANCSAFVAAAAGEGAEDGTWGQLLGIWEFDTVGTVLLLIGRFVTEGVLLKLLLTTLEVEGAVDFCMEGIKGTLFPFPPS